MGVVTRTLAVACTVLASMGCGVMRITSYLWLLDSTDVETAEVQLTVIHDYDDGLAGVRVANPDVRLSVDRDPSLPDEKILVVEYPVRGEDPAGRDVWCVVRNRDWTAGRAISFQVKPDHDLRLSMSVLDRNRVAYTAWTELKGGVWQLIRIPFDGIRPNPFFQPPDARAGGPIDVSEVRELGFAPQDQTSGRLAIGRLFVSQ
jgi:hypothetical protein